MLATLYRSLLTGLCCAGLCVHPGHAAAPDWSANRFGELPATCAASGYGVAQGTATLEIYLDKARPGTVVLVAQMKDTDKSELAFTPATLVVSFPDGPMEFRGLMRRFENLADEFTADVVSADVPRLLHGLTSNAEPIPIAIPGHSAPQMINLKGSSKAVDAMERCIRSKAFSSAPAPFRGASDTLTAEAARCLREGDVVTLTGTLIKRQAADPDGIQDFPELRLNSPACVYRFGSLQPFQPAVEVMLLEAPVGATFSPPPQTFGKPMQVTGRLRDAVSKYDVEPNVLTMTLNRR